MPVKKNEKIVVAIDGVSSSGKSTVARALAQKLGYTYIDTGAMYRALTYYAINKGYLSTEEFLKNLFLSDLDTVNITFDKEGHVLLSGEPVEDKIRSMEVASNVSMIAAIAQVRMLMVALQREIGKNKGIVMDGRDIGSVVFPDAELKVYMDASPEVRAERRMKELQEKGLPVDYSEVLENIRARDQADTTREVSPLVKADDAVELDTSDMTREEQLEKLLALARGRMGETKS